MKIFISFMIISNISNANVQSKNVQSFYAKFNNLLLEVKESLISSKEFVGDIYSLKSDEKSRVLILDYVEAYDQLLSICHDASELISIYEFIPLNNSNKELLDTVEKKIIFNFINLISKMDNIIDSFVFYIESKFHNYKKIETLKSNMLQILNEVRTTIDQL